MPLQNAVRIGFRTWCNRIDIGSLVILLRTASSNERLVSNQIAGHRDHVDDVRSFSLWGIAVKVVTKNRVTSLVPVSLKARPAGAATRIDIDIRVPLDEKIRQVDRPLLVTIGDLHSNDDSGGVFCDCESLTNRKEAIISYALSALHKLIIVVPTDVAADADNSAAGSIYVVLDVIGAAGGRLVD